MFGRGSHINKFKNEGYLMEVKQITDKKTVYNFLIAGPIPAYIRDG